MSERERNYNTFCEVEWQTEVGGIDKRQKIRIIARLNERQQLKSETGAPDREVITFVLSLHVLFMIQFVDCQVITYIFSARVLAQTQSMR